MRKVLIALCFLAAAISINYSHATNKDDYNWQLARKLILSNKPIQAISVLNSLLRKSDLSSDIDKNQVYLTLGRAFYQLENYVESIKNYQNITKSSDFWPLSVEEMAWAYVALGKEEMALAKLQSLMTPIFDQVIGPEPYFLKAFAHLKICDYIGVFKTTDHFKKRYKDRILNLENLVKNNGKHSESIQLITMGKNGNLSFDLLTKKLEAFPFMFHRDKYLQRYFEELKRKSKSAEISIFKRLKYLAQRDLQEIRKNLKLLHLIEAEAIQRVHIAYEPNNKFRNHANFGGSEWLKFPSQGEEIWIDEIDKFHVQVKDCPKLEGRKKWAKK